jgi:hypothetical protein
MKTKSNQEDTGKIAFESSAMDLRGRQSVRATFRLSAACIDAISILAAQLGIKQKSVFDHLMEDNQILEHMASRLENDKFDRDGRIQKTYVISRRSLADLEKISKAYNASRDALVEQSIRRLLPIIAKERKKHEKRKKLWTDISNHFSRGESLKSMAEERLGADDPIVTKLSNAISVYKNAVNDIAVFIERGKIIEEFDLEAEGDSRRH